MRRNVHGLYAGGRGRRPGAKATVPHQPAGACVVDGSLGSAGQFQRGSYLVGIELCPVAEDLQDASACVPGGAGRATVRAAAQRSGARLVDPSAAVEAYLRIFGARAGVEDPAEQARSEEESRRVTLLELARAVLVSLRAEELSRSAEAGR